MRKIIPEINMPMELHVIRASEFVRLDAEEVLDFEESKRALQAIALACRKRGLDGALLDLRGVPMPAKPKFTPTELAELVGTFRDAGFSRKQRLAILYRNDPHGGIGKFAFLGRMRGLRVLAFEEFETAYGWLAEASLDRSEEQGEAVPIRHGHRKRLKPVFGPAATRPVRKSGHGAKRTSNTTSRARKTGKSRLAR